MRIVSSAIKFTLFNDDYPIIMTAKRHCDVLEKMFNLKLNYNRNTMIQGFLTDDDTFVDRFEAASIAYNANQIDNEIITLYSEDIWPD